MAGVKGRSGRRKKGEEQKRHLAGFEDKCTDYLVKNFDLLEPVEKLRVAKEIYLKRKAKIEPVVGMSGEELEQITKTAREAVKAAQERVVVGV